MDLQTVYYTVGIVFMVLAILILISIAVLVFYIRKKVSDLQTFIELRINEMTALSLKPVKAATDIAKSILPPPKRTARRKK